jgi:transcriptional regulator GlxA family with amidase domain
MRVLGVLKPRRAARKPLDDNQIAEINRLVASRLEEGITLNEVAQRLGVHPTAVTHRLQRNFGISYSEYVGRLRVDKAKDLLRRTKLGAGAIARRVGIGDTSNFSKLFRKYEGVSPGEYRNRFRCTDNKS